MMLDTILLATGNRGKLRELRNLLAPLGVEVLAPADRDLDIDVVEDADTFAGNALKKARAYARAARLPCLSDDSGLEVDALDGAPGVRSARYAGDEATDEDNKAKLLDALAGTPSAQRGARFRCALVLVDPDGDVLCQTQGTCEGTILEEPRGTGGFGYDPLFLPEGSERSMAELSAEEKNAISHRAVATRALRDWLERQRG